MKSVLPKGVILHRRYSVGHVLGSGGFGITYAAFDLAGREWTAVKEYFPGEWAVRMPQGNQIVPESPEKGRFYEHGMKTFYDEAERLINLQNIPDVVKAKDFFPENGTVYLVMELLKGYTLRDYMRYRGIKAMSPEEAGRIIKAAGMALIQVHGYGYLHRDVGPDNIMLTNAGRICLIDFGATRVYALNSAKSMSVLVKPGFAPIEQYSRSGKQGPWTDVYALAATYYFMVTGEKPPGAPERIAGARVAPLDVKVPGIPGYISRAVERALSEDWRNRPRSVCDFLGEMGLLRRAHVRLQAGGRDTSYYFMPDDSLSIGREAGKSNVVLHDSQVSALHCKIWYDEGEDRFLLANYSGNYTYTSRGILHKGQSIWLIHKDWFYIQTKHARYIFYPEVR
ncbi:FHA domain-containing serine/threonine-protein kinase [Lachnospiraceae bacterium 48-42]